MFKTLFSPIPYERNGKIWPIICVIKNVTKRVLIKMFESDGSVMHITSYYTDGYFNCSYYVIISVFLPFESVSFDKLKSFQSESFFRVFLVNSRFLLVLLKRVILSWPFRRDVLTRKPFRHTHPSGTHWVSSAIRLVILFVNDRRDRIRLSVAVEIVNVNRQNHRRTSLSAYYFEFFEQKRRLRGPYTNRAHDYRNFIHTLTYRLFSFFFTHILFQASPISDVVTYRFFSFENLSNSRTRQFTIVYQLSAKLHYDINNLGKKNVTYTMISFVILWFLLFFVIFP